MSDDRPLFLCFDGSDDARRAVEEALFPGVGPELRRAWPRRRSAVTLHSQVAR